MHLDHRPLIAATAALALALPITAGAQTYVNGTTKESGFYVGTLMGYASIDVGLDEWNKALASVPVVSGSSITSSSVTKGDFAWGVNLGYQLMRYFALEIGYLDLGKSEGDVAATIAGTPGTGKAQLKSSGIETAAIGILPFDYGWAMDGRLGIYFGDDKVQVNGGTSAGSFSAGNNTNTSSFLGGVGVSYSFYRNYQVRFDYMYIDKIGDAGPHSYTAKADNFSLGFRYTW